MAAIEKKLPETKLDIKPYSHMRSLSNIFSRTHNVPLTAAKDSRDAK